MLFGFLLLPITPEALRWQAFKITNLRGLQVAQLSDSTNVGEDFKWFND
jgi:hypothetical protein